MRSCLMFILVLALASRLFAEDLAAWPQVNLANANVVLERTELRLYWAGPTFALARVYNSRVHEDQGLGWGWRTTYSRALAFTPGASELSITEDDGAVTRYRQVEAPAGQPVRFEPD